MGIVIGTRYWLRYYSSSHLAILHYSARSGWTSRLLWPWPYRRVWDIVAEAN
jgi:hypothetical protein